MGRATGVAALRARSSSDRRMWSHGATELVERGLWCGAGTACAWASCAAAYHGASTCPPTECRSGAAYPLLDPIPAKSEAGTAGGKGLDETEDEMDIEDIGRLSTSNAASYALATAAFGMELA